MSRGSFGRSVARAAASGGGKAYRSKAPVAWYAIVVAICVVGVSLIVYSRNEKLHPQVAAKSTVGPTASDHWYAALAVDICGVVQPPLSPSSNLSTVGLRTFGDGLIDIDPSVAKTPATYDGVNATLGQFASSYSGLTLSPTSVKLPGKNQKLWTNGAHCTAHGSDPAGKGSLVIVTWPSPTGKGKVVPSSDPTAVHLNNGEMITVAFVTPHSAIAVPTSRGTLISNLGITVKAHSTPSSVTAPGTATVTATTVGPTPTTAKASTTTTTVKPTATTKPKKT